MMNIYPIWLCVVTLAMCSLSHGSTASTDAPTQAPTGYILPGNDTANTTEQDQHTNKSTPVMTTTLPKSTTPDFSYIQYCPDEAPCENLGASCITCKLNHYCTYGDVATANCTVKPNISCTGSRTFRRPYDCRYGYQLSADKFSCYKHLATTCTMKKAPQETFFASCNVKEDVICLGNRTFYKKFPCNWTKGYKWSTALVLSVTLGGFGVDRFYLGLWREGIGKLFSFGGLGVWTIVDVILIAVGYVGPHDSSLYIYPWD